MSYRVCRVHRQVLSVPVAGGLKRIADGISGRLAWCSACGAIRQGVYLEKPSPDYFGWPFRWGRWRKPYAR